MLSVVLIGLDVHHRRLNGSVSDGLSVIKRDDLLFIHTLLHRAAALGLMRSCNLHLSFSNGSKSLDHITAAAEELC